MKVSIIYYSTTGNTKAMAEAIKKGAAENAATISLKEVSNATADDITSADVVLFGCAASGVEQLDETVFEPFIDSILDKVAGKKIALFGSYGWGDGQWMRDWEEKMRAANANLIEESLIVLEYPDAEAITKCIEFGKNTTK